ncbi:MAG: type II secretion system protein [Alphaproteobacteria bacterium]|nr:type II secretion system protein [Alphaproteobacteria bacterium]
MKSENGRSMVEMLGVLAIIGVLSVGAIAGYSKAMMKHKLNQHAVAVNMLINNVLSIKDKLQHTEYLTYYGTLLYKLNLLPDGIKYINNEHLIEMWFKESVWVYYYNFQRPDSFGGIGFQIPPTAQGAEICRNIALAAKENAANLWVVQMQKHYNDTSKPYDYIGNLWGDNYCSNGQTCLRNLDLNKTERLCNDCNERSCYLYVLWK